MSATLVTAAEAGWYHDPSDSGSWRWWDGATWTSHVRPKELAAPPVLPQPAQPIQPLPPVQPVSLTPETPASEQEYWHSPGAEIVQIPGRTATTQHSAFPGAGTGGTLPYNMTHEWGDVGSPQTPGIWLLASLPIISVGLQVVVGIMVGIVWGTTGANLTPPNVVFTVILLTLAWIFAGLDVRALRARGYDAPKIWWMLLIPPLAYFIARGRVVRREGQRAWPPELLYFLSILGFILIGVAYFVLAMSVMGGLPTQLA